MAENPNVIETVVDASPENVASIRKEMTTAAIEGNAGGSVPIDRMPLNPQLELLVKSGVYSKRIASTDRCIRLVDIPKVGNVHCSRPCVSVGDQRMCPDHDKSFFQPNQTAHGTKPRTFNSASIALTKAELAECGGKPADVQPEPLPTVKPAPEPVRGEPVSAEFITLHLGLDELNAHALKSILADRITAALDEMPATNIKRMKQVVALQERIAKILGGSK